MEKNDINNDDSNKLKSLSNHVFSISLILDNIFLHLALEKDIFSCILVNHLWNQLATERLWYRFRGLKNDLRTNSFSRFYVTLSSSKSMHQYGRYVRVLDLSQLEVEHNRLLSVLECCNRLEVLILGNQELKKKTINEICSRSKYLRTFKLIDIEIKEPDVMAALGKYCHNLEELSLKKEIACSGEILLSIVKNCPKLFKLEIEGKDYNNQTLYKILENCPNILTLNINQCMNITDELLIATYKLCTNLKKLSFKKIFEITENFVISTLNHFPRTSTIVISNIDRMFQSSIEVDGEKIFLVANLCDVDIHRIIDFYSIKEDGLQELTFIDVKLDKSLLNFICIELNGLFDIMNALENLKELQIFTVKFSSVDHEAFFENDKEQLVKYCPKLKAIKWHFQKIYIKDNNRVLK
nr:5263_t:CDS:2 [Entrophospora candida]